MNLIEFIPIGKKQKKTRQELMYKAKITDINVFKKQIGELKEQYIILYDDGYYLPSSQEEYSDFINNQKEKIKDIEKLIELAYKRMEEV